VLGSIPAGSAAARSTRRSRLHRGAELTQDGCWKCPLQGNFDEGWLPSIRLDLPPVDLFAWIFGHILLPAVRALRRPSGIDLFLHHSASLPGASVILALFLIVARFNLPIHLRPAALAANLRPALRTRGLLISAWSNSIHAIDQVRDLDADFQGLGDAVTPLGVHDLAFIQVARESPVLRASLRGAQLWSSKVAPLYTRRRDWQTTRTMVSRRER
jgi:hypothetical protein